MCVRVSECGGYRKREVSEPGNGNSISATYRSFVIVPSSFWTDAHMRENNHNQRGTVCYAEAEKRSMC